MAVDSGFICPFCDSGFTTASLLQEHVNLHLESGDSSLTDSTGDRELAVQLQHLEEQEQQEFKKLQAQYGMDGRGSFTEQTSTSLCRDHMQNRVDLHTVLRERLSLQRLNATGMEDSNFPVKDLMAKIRDLSLSSRDVSDSYFCSNADHFGTTRGDTGWGCGYRNFQMLLSSIASSDQLRVALFGDVYAIPSVRKIQELLEAAWSKGFDELGAHQLGEKVLNTRKWIGTTEVMAVLQSFGLRVQIIDFHRSTGPNSTHPHLFSYVWDHFSRTNASFKPCLYFQHEGHSRTIVGIEKTASSQLRLLVFDPSNSRQKMTDLKQAQSPSALNFLRKTLSDLKKSQYQLLVVTGELMSAEESEVVKRCPSFVKIP